MCLMNRWDSKESETLYRQPGRSRDRIRTNLTRPMKRRRAMERVHRAAAKQAPQSHRCRSGKESSLQVDGKGILAQWPLISRRAAR